jgi:hypothetical protein
VAPLASTWDMFNISKNASSTGTYSGLCRIL